MARDPRTLRSPAVLGALERLTGRLTGLDNDRGGSLAGLWRRNQMDCVDESTNTRAYLTMLQNDGLLRYHVVAQTARRFRPYLYQHYTAVIRETASGRLYAVDSWFFDNGQPAVVLPLETWEKGWVPRDPMPESGPP